MESDICDSGKNILDCFQHIKKQAKRIEVVSSGGNFIYCEAL